MLLELSPLAAETDLEAIGDYIAIDSPGDAVVRIERILHSALDIRSELLPYIFHP